MNLHERAASLDNRRKQNKKNERHVTVAETSYWLNQHKLLADDQAALIAAMDARIVDLEHFIELNFTQHQIVEDDTTRKKSAP